MEFAIRGEIKTLRFKKDNDPVWHGLGVYTDVDGNQWDVHGIFCNKDGKFIQARPYSSYDFRYSTASFGFNGPEPGGLVTTTWIPYRVELVD